MMKRFIVNPKGIKAASAIKSSEILPGYSEDDVIDLADRYALAIAEDSWGFPDVYTAKQAANAGLQLFGERVEEDPWDFDLPEGFVLTPAIKKKLLPYFVKAAKPYNWGESRW